MNNPSFKEETLPKYLEPQIVIGPPQSFDLISRTRKHNLQTRVPFSTSYSPHTQIECNYHFRLENLSQTSHALNESSQKPIKPVAKRKEVSSTPRKRNHGTWSEEEHQRFLEGFSKYGRKWGKIAKEFVGTRDRTQVASHGQKFLAKLSVQSKS